MNLIMLAMIVSEDGGIVSHEGEDDGVATIAPAQQVLTTAVKATKIRNVHPRKYGKSGTRVVFENGSALVVSDTFEEVVHAWQDALAADAAGQVIQDDGTRRPVAG